MARQVAGPQVVAHGWLLVPHNRRQYLFHLHTAGPSGPLARVYLYTLPAGTTVEDETFRLYQGGGGAERTYEAEVTQGGAGVICSCPGYGHRRSCWHAEYLGHLAHVWGHAAPLIANPPPGGLYSLGHAGLAGIVAVVGTAPEIAPIPDPAPAPAPPTPVQAAPAPPDVSQAQSTLDDLLGGF